MALLLINRTFKGLQERGRKKDYELKIKKHLVVTKNTDSYSSKIAIISGFSLVLVLLISVVLLATYSIVFNSQQIASVVDEQSEMSNVFQMRDAAHNRALMLYRMASLDDPFERDEIYLQFMEKAEIFIKSRDSLLEKIYAEDEIFAWEEVKPNIIQGSRVQNKAVNLILNDEIDKAHDLLLNEVIPTQDVVMAGLTKMLNAQNKIVNSKLSDAQISNQTLFVAIVSMGGIALLVGVAATILVTRYNTRIEMAHLEQQKLAQSASEAKSNFLANMSHEIRTPLTAIIGFSEALNDYSISSEERDQINKTIIRNSKHLQQVISDILDLSKIEAEQLEIENIPVSVIQVMFEIESIVGMRVRDKGLNFEVNFHFPLPRMIFTDPVRLKQIIINLCSNAIKFTHEGGVEINVKNQGADDALVFEIKDSGIGMSEEEQDRVFHPFTQADTSTTRKYGGTGLGLSISQQLAQRLGGGLQCESEKGKGSTFVLTIATGSQQDVAMLNNLEEFLSDNTLKKDNVTVMPLTGNILLAEDSVDIQKLVSMYIRKTGADLKIVDNGKRAVEEGLVSEYDLILMDMQMPVMDGVEAITLLRQAGYTRPIVSLTANVLKSDKENFLYAGADDYLLKPINLNWFYEILNKYLPQASNIQSEISLDLDDDFDYQQLIMGFLSSLPEKIDELNRAVQANDWATIRSVSHKLKGMGGSFGFPEISKLAKAVNEKANQEEMAMMLDLVADLRRTCDDIVATYRAA